MAAFVQKTARFSSGGATSITSASITTTAGNLAVVTVSHWVGSTNGAPTFSDSKTNSGWAEDVGVNDAGPTNSRATIGSVQLVSAGAGHTFTLSHAVSSAWEGNVSEFSGLLTSSPLDKTGTAAHAGGGTSAAPTTAATTQADELVVACLAINDSSANSGISDPPTTGYTSIGVNQDSNATNGYEGAYKIVSSTGAQSATWTFNATSSGDSAVVATYKATASTDTLMGQACL